MIFTWEPNDVIAGRRVGRATRQEQWMIGYDPTARRACASGSKDEMAVRLNASGDYPVEAFPMMKRAGEEAER